MVRFARDNGYEVTSTLRDESRLGPQQSRLSGSLDRICTRPRLSDRGRVERMDGWALLNVARHLPRALNSQNKLLRRKRVRQFLFGRKGDTATYGQHIKKR